MIRKMNFWRWLGIISLVSLFLFNGAVYVINATASKDVPDAGRADLIVIDTMKQFKDLERPPVVFFHEKHTVAVEKKNKDCKTCHVSENDKLSLKYMRQSDRSADIVQNIYHDNCIACHKSTTQAGEPSGPVECGECHVKDYQVASVWQPMGFDKSLHYRHTKAQQDKCEACHHAYNSTKKTLFYDKGKEGSCRYCHKEVAEENRISNRLASHMACIDCHTKTLAENKDAGPVTCSGCHDPADQKLIEKIDPVPRLKRGQPDVLLVKAFRITEGNPESIRMNQVPFDHKAHETYNDSCRVCHHADLKNCVGCHTQTGSKENQNVTLERAMHQVDADSSCLGCHAKIQAEPSCAGCHASIPNEIKQNADTCQACHVEPPSGLTASHGNPEDPAIASALLKSRSLVTEIFSDADIPETVVIKGLTDEYKPVELPHRKIIKTLTANIKDNRLAGYFHQNAGTVCQGCHHNSPVSKKPPSCISCHGLPFDANHLLRPGIKAAYHRQCMECHDAMGIEKPVSTDCTGCHRKKA